MGQDGKDGEGDHPNLTIEPGAQRPARFGEVSRAVFKREVRAAVRYERGLAVKAALVLLLVAIIVILRTLYFS